MAFLLKIRYKKHRKCPTRISMANVKPDHIFECLSQCEPFFPMWTSLLDLWGLSPRHVNIAQL